MTTTLVLKGTNFCPDDNPLCKKGPHFDIAAPGFDVPEASFANTCAANEPDEAAGNILLVKKTFDELCAFSDQPFFSSFFCLMVIQDLLRARAG